MKTAKESFGKRAGAALTVPLSHSRLWLAFAGGNLALLVAVFGWLSLPDRSVWHVGLTVLSGLAILFIAFWLHGGALASFQPASANAAFRVARQRICGFAPWALLIALCAAVCLVILPGEGGPLQRTSQATVAMSGQAVQKWQDAAGPALPWFLFLVAVVAIGPFLAGAAGGGLTRAKALRLVLRWDYWLFSLLDLCVACGAAGLLIVYVPEAGGIPLETISMLLRFTMAVLVATAGWLAFAAYIGYEADAESGESIPAEPEAPAAA